MHSRQSAHLLLVVLSLCSVAAGAEEQLEQDTIVIKGNQGLPRTVYIAPWKRVGAPLDSGTLEGEVGEETEPLERDLFQRELELQREGYSTEKLTPVQTTTQPTGGSGASR